MIRMVVGEVDAVDRAEIRDPLPQGWEVPPRVEVRGILEPRIEQESGARVESQESRGVAQRC